MLQDVQNLMIIGTFKNCRFAHPEGYNPLFFAHPALITPSFLHTTIYKYLLYIKNTIAMHSFFKFKNIFLLQLITHTTVLLIYSVVEKQIIDFGFKFNKYRLIINPGIVYRMKYQKQKPSGSFAGGAVAVDNAGPYIFRRTE